MTTNENAQTFPLDAFTDAANASAAVLIRRYSTSFSAASRLLEPYVRSQVRTIYALARVADEIVDGAAAEAGLGVVEQREELDAFEQETERAMRRGFSTNLVVHAFATTARQTGIGVELTAPFFASMRRDLDAAPLDHRQVTDYIHGSAEVIGLMCLAAFIAGQDYDDDELRILEHGARRLGAAFQKVNFLRDLTTDWGVLGRNYFPGIDPTHLGERDKLMILDDIDADLTAAAAAIPLLPRGSRGAVRAAHDLFARLADRLRATPAEQLLAHRVRVPAAEKLGIAVHAAVTGGGRER